MNHKRIAYALARITLGINFLIHGLVRIPKIAQFKDGIVSGFSDTFLPTVLVTPFAASLPFFELSIGLLLLIGLFTRQVLMAAGLLIIILVFGSGIKEEWGVVGTQMVYALFIFFLLFFLENNGWALDEKVERG